MNDGFKNRTYFLAGELAKAAGVSRDTLRHYERKGVLMRPSRAKNGYRQYPDDALNRVLIIQKALSVGFTLDELAQILNERQKGGAPCRKVRALVGGKLLKVEEQIINLGDLRNELQSTLKDWDTRLKDVKSDSQAGLLETLVTKDRVPAINNRDLHPKLKNQKEGKK